jgi:hypothetical protein
MLRMLAIGVLCLSVCASCTEGQLDARDAQTQEAKDSLRGFRTRKTDCPSLYISDEHSSLWLLFHSVPEGEDMDYTTFEHSTDGKQARAWDVGGFGDRREEVIVIEAGRPPRVIETPTGAFLDRKSHVVLTVARAVNKSFRLHCAGGKILECWDFKVDYDGQYVCIPDNGSEAGDVPITIRSTSDPERVLATTQIKGNLWRIFVVGRRLYVFLRPCYSNGAPQYPEPMLCEIYRQEERALVWERSFEIRAPSTWWTRNIEGALWTLVADVCPEGKHLLISQTMELGGFTRYYLYDLETGRFTNLGDLSRYSFTCFLDSALLAGR